MSRHPARSKIFINGPIQGTLVTRIALYWLLSLFIQAALIMVLSAGTGRAENLYQLSEQFWWHAKLVLAAAILTLPLLAFDVIKLSHRWVGPIYRLRTAMDALALGEDVQPLTFRAGDYWQDLAVSFNAVLRRVEHARDTRDHLADDPALPVEVADRESPVEFTDHLTTPVL
jgi:hypothetical protein